MDSKAPPPLSGKCNQSKTPGISTFERGASFTLRRARFSGSIGHRSGRSTFHRARRRLKRVSGYLTAVVPKLCANSVESEIKS